MSSTARSILNGIATIIFIIVMAAVLSFIGFILVVVAFYYTIQLFLDVGLLAGAAAIITVGAVLWIATYKLIKKIQKG